LSNNAVSPYAIRTVVALGGDYITVKIPWLFSQIWLP